MHRSRFVLVPLSLAAETAAGVLALTPPRVVENVVAALLLHVGASLVFGWTASRRRPPPADAAAGLLAGVVALLGFPCFGMLAMTSGSIGAWALQLRRGGRSPAPGASEAAAGPSSPSVARPESSQADLWAVLDVEPFADLLTGHDPDLKRGAIDALVRAQGYGAVPVLRRLLRDPDSEIRLYASVALGKLEDQIGQALLAARTAAEADPNEPTAWGELARLYVEYASCGFLAPSMARHYLELAHQAYETARRLRPEQGQLALALCRARLQFGDLEVAERYLEVAVWDSLADPHTHLALMELEYRRGGLAQVAQHATDAARLLKGSYPQQDVVDWWAALA